MSNWNLGSSSSSDQLRRNGSFSSSSQPYHPIAEDDGGDVEQRPSSPSALPHSSQPPPSASQPQQSLRASQSPPPGYSQYNAETAPSSVASSVPIAASSPPVSSKVVTVNLRTLSGQVMSVQFTTLEGVTVLDLKRRLEATHSIPVSFQRLIFSGRELQDAELCSAYGMEDSSMVHLLLRQNQQPASTAAAVDSVSAASSQPVAYPPLDASGMGSFNGISIPVQPATDYPLSLSEEEAERLQRTMQLSRAVKIISLIDFIWLFVFAVRDPVFLVLGVLLLCGYYGAHQYNRRLVAVFVPFVVLSVGARVFIMIRYPSTSTYVINAFGLVLDLYLFRLVSLFYRFLSSISPADRAELIDLNRANFGGGFGY